MNQIGERVGHPHDDEDVSQAFGTGDSQWQREAEDNAERAPSEGAAVDYDEDVPGAPEPPD